MITQEPCPESRASGHQHAVVLDFNDEMAAVCRYCGGVWRIKVSVMGPKGLKKVDISTTDAAWVRVE